MKKLDSVEKLLVVVDMVKGFLKLGKMADPFIAHIVPTQLKIIESFVDNQEGLAFVKEAHHDHCREFQRYPQHCLKSSDEAQLVDELIQFETQALVYEKNSTSVIFNEHFIKDINEMINLKEITIIGCCTDICVLNLAIPLQNYFDEMDRYIKIIVVKNAVETYQGEDHDRDEFNKMAFRLMKQAGIDILESYRG